MLFVIFFIVCFAVVSGHVSSLENALLYKNPELKAPPSGVAFVHYNFFSGEDDPSVMLLSYYTQEQTSGTSCKYGTVSGSLSLVSSGSSSAWKSGYGFTHHVLLQHLKNDTTYYFKCGFNDNVGWSAQEYQFKTRASKISSLNIGVWGDMGIDNSADTIKRIQARTDKKEFDFAWHIGDISYADDHVFWFQETWNAWFAMISGVMQNVPYMVLPGNHEWASLDPFLYEETKNFLVYNHRFLMPQTSPQEKTNSSMWYSFDFGPVHFISISTESSYPNAPHDEKLFGDQMTWLKADLAKASANRAVRPWIVVAGHRPIYSSAFGYSSNGVPEDSPIPYVPINSATLQKVFEPLYLQHKVDLVLAGHVHSYERLFPTAHNHVVQTHYQSPSAPTYVVVGNAGNIEGATQFGPKAPWTAYRENGYGYGTLQVNGSHSLTWTYHHATDDRALDTFTIQK